ncbi:MAG TPA: hypothetical protein VNV25_02450 [Gemmatimonadaceae bacterium]|nr:hypothetical protein [Gemmatimonadaceae bacterium]
MAVRITAVNHVGQWVQIAAAAVAAIFAGWAALAASRQAGESRRLAQQGAESLGATIKQVEDAQSERDEARQARLDDRRRDENTTVSRRRALAWGVHTELNRLQRVIEAVKAQPLPPYDSTSLEHPALTAAFHDGQIFCLQTAVHIVDCISVMGQLRAEAISLADYVAELEAAALAANRHGEIVHSGRRPARIKNLAETALDAINALVRDLEDEMRLERPPCKEPITGSLTLGLPLPKSDGSAS